MKAWGSETDDHLLVAAAVDPGAFAEFYARYERAMLAFFMHRTRDPELAADLTAEVFAAALAWGPAVSAGWGARGGVVVRDRAAQAGQEPAAGHGRGPRETETGDAGAGTGG